MTLFELDDLRCCLSARKLIDLTQASRYNLLSERIVVRARGRIAFVQSTEKIALFRRCRLANSFAYRAKLLGLGGEPIPDATPRARPAREKFRRSL